MFHPKIWCVFALGLVLAAGCQPHGPNALRRGDELRRAGKLEDAITMLERAASDIPTEPRAWNYLGLTYQAAGKPLEAQKAYLRALKEDRNFFDAHYNLGALFAEQQEWVEAERSLRTYLTAEVNQSNGIAWRLLGEAQLKNRSFDLAQRSLATAIGLQPKDSELWNSLGLAEIGKRRFPKAREDFAWAINLDPKNAAARLNLAVTTHQYLGDAKAALPLYRDYLIVAPPGGQADSIRALIQQLEQTVNQAPQPLVPPVKVPVGKFRTNSVQVITNKVAPANTGPSVPRPPPPVTTSAPPPSATNTSAPPATVAPPVIRSASVITQSPPALTAVSNPPPRVITEPAPEVVKLDDSPAVRPLKPEANPVPPALDETIARKPNPQIRAAESPSLSATNSSPLVAISSNTPSPIAVVEESGAEPVPSDPVGAPGSDSTKRSFWRKANPLTWGNPVKWFRTASTPAKATNSVGDVRTTPLPKPGAEVAKPMIADAPKPKLDVSKSDATVAAYRMRPLKSIPVRYPRRTGAEFPPGNRTEAEKLVEVGVTAFDSRNLSEAITAYQGAVKADPAYFVAYYNLALASLEAGETSRALSSAEAATLVDPRSAPAHRLFGVALSRGNYPADAAEEFEKAISLQQDDVALRLSLAAIYAGKLGEPEKARPHYERVLAMDPKNSESAAIRRWLQENQ
jgi:tetratricopeptide (TPR) repeat protein